jgi:hypothetical protein
MDRSKAGPSPGWPGGPPRAYPPAMRMQVLAVVVLGGLSAGSPAWAREPRCHVSFTRARPGFPRCSMTAPCIEGQPCASMAQLVECGQTVSGCGKTFECRCSGPEAKPQKQKRPAR